jgi:hypothetical protein
MSYIVHQQVIVATRRSENLYEQTETSFRMGLFGPNTPRRTSQSANRIALIGG